VAASFILGINDSVDGSYALSTDRVYALTGHNTGNLAFHYALVKILGGHQDALPWHTPPERLNQMRRTGVIPCANQLGSHADYGNLAVRFKMLDIPLLAIGLGAQGDAKYETLPEVPEGSVSWVREIANRSVGDAPNIGVRGPFTLKVLEKYGLADKAVVTGCPTLFLNPTPNLGKMIEEKAKNSFDHVAVAAGHPKWGHLSRIEASLGRILEETGGSYIVQSPMESVAIARGEATLLSQPDLEESRNFVCPGMELADFVKWSRRYYRLYLNVSEWMECLRGYDFVIGARIHGVILGLQAGIPGLCIAHDSRTRELCETMKVPFVMASDISSGVKLPDLRDMFTFDSNEFDHNRRELARTLDNILKQNQLPESAWLKAILA
jgi:Polysaccharide pyruvyl transferase